MKRILLLMALLPLAGCSSTETPVATETVIAETQTRLITPMPSETPGASATPEGSATPAASSTPEAKPVGPPVTTKSGLQYQVFKKGTGAVATKGQTVSVHYTGTFKDGTKFDSSLDRGEPIEFPLGTGAVIAGWDEGIAGMKEGEKRKLTIPSDLAYGDAGRPGIPPKSTLYFDVELVKVK